MGKNQPNIFLITIDCLRADHCQFLGYHKRTTPFLDSIAKNSTIFPDFYANSIPTNLAFPTILTGKKPFVLDEMLGIPDGVDTIAEILKKEGYATFAFIANNPALYKELGYNRGFDVFESFREYEFIKSTKMKTLKESTKRILPEGITRVLDYILPIRGYLPNAVELTSNVVGNLKKHQDVPFFCWVHYMDAHSPFVNGYSRFVHVHGRKPSLFQLKHALRNFNRLSQQLKSEQRKISDTEIEKSLSDLNLVRDLYDAAINLFDSQIKRLISEVNELFKDGESIFFITSDHGSGFMERGYIEYLPYNQLIKIPLLIYSSKNEAGEIIEHPLGHSALLKMMMSIAKESRLTVPERDHYLISEIPYGCIHPLGKIRDNRTKIGVYDKLVSVLMNGYKYIINYKTGLEELYNIAIDPVEKFNILEKHKELAGEMLSMYEEWKREREKERLSLKRKLLAQKVKRLRTS